MELTRFPQHQKAADMKNSSAILKSLIVVGILTFGLIADVSARGFGASQQGRHSPPIRPPVPPIWTTNCPPIQPTNPPPIQIIECTPSPAGLVGWWKGEGNTSDSVFGNNGVAQNIAYTNGKVGQAFLFFGISSWPHSQISVPDQPMFELTNSLSIEGWINPADTGGTSGMILWRGDCRGGYDPYFLQMNEDNTLGFYIEDGTGGPAAAVMTPVPLANNQWCHVAATLDGTTGTMSLYTNGVLAAQTVTTLRPFGALDPSLEPTIGIGNVGTICWDYVPFNGAIDEISLYSRALSAGEIQALYAAGSAGKCPPACTPPPSGLVGWWQAESNANDVVSANNGVAQNITYTTGVVGQAFACDPDNYPYGTYAGIQVPDSPAYVLTNSLTIEGWVRPRGDSYSIFWRGDNRPGLDPYYLAMWGNNNIRFAICDADGNVVTVGTYLTYNQWTHVAATLDGSTGTMNIYTNGVLADQIMTTIRPFGDLIPGDSPGIGIGNINDGGNNFPFIGDIDEISLYNRALSAAEVQAIYSTGNAGKCSVIDCAPPPSGLASWWPGEGNANDNSGLNNGLLENVTFASGMVGQAFVFDGSSSDVRVPASSNLDVGLGNGFTLEAWINPALLSIDGWLPLPIFEWNSGSGYGDASVGVQFVIGINNGSGNLAANIEDTATGFHVIYSADNILTSNVFQHVALTYDKTTGLAALYRNGVVVATNNLGVFTPQTSFDLYLGRRVAGPFAPFNFKGMIDEPSVYNRALSAAEIQAIYNAGAAGKCGGFLPPGITVQPVNQTTVAGSNVVLSVVASGTGPFSYQWSFNGTNILGATNATLTLTNLHSYQSGNYAVTVTSPYGSITSANASVTVIARNILIYKYAGIQKTITAGKALSYGYAGQMFFTPDNTNGVFVGWATIKGKKQYWVNPLPEYLWITIVGVSNQTFTVLGQAGQGIDTNGCANLWSDLHKGKNAQLIIGKNKYFSFPNTLANDATHVYPDPQTGNMVLDESGSIFVFLAQNTQKANNTGQTLTDLVNTLIQWLESQGYQKQ
jgi:hypothetical protein